MKLPGSCRQLLAKGVNLCQAPGQQHRIHPIIMICQPLCILQSGLCLVWQARLLYASIMQRLQTKHAPLKVMLLARGQPPYEVAEQLQQQQAKHALMSHALALGLDTKLFLCVAWRCHKSTGAACNWDKQ